MRYRDRQGRAAGEESGQDVFLGLLYGTAAGRLLVRGLICPPVSRLGGELLSTRMSKLLIGPFVRRNGIRLEDYETPRTGGYASYNDFFCRKIREGLRPVSGDQECFISPSDGKVSVYPIGPDARFRIKDTEYTAACLLRSERLAERYRGGYAYVFRLTVDDYHRYCYVESGIKSRQRRIPGVFHTVNPAANDQYPIYKENTREYCLIRTRRAGTVIQMEVGALLVGKICNYAAGRQDVQRGQEKGRFEFGGSTVVVLVEPGKVIPDKDLLENTQEGWETAVRYGECVGRLVSADEAPSRGDEQGDGL